MSGWPAPGLRRLALASALAAACCVVLLGVLGARDWRQARSAMADAERMLQLSGEVERLRMGANYITLLQADGAIAREVGADALRLASLIGVDDGAEAQLSARHLREVANVFAAIAGNRLELQGDDAHSLRLRQDVARELRIHFAMINDSLVTLVHERQRRSSEVQREAGGSFLALALLLGVAGVWAFARVYRRMSDPIQAIERGIARFASGQLDARITPSRDDELGRLASAFNRMAEQREHQVGLLADSEKRLRVLTTAVTDSTWDLDLSSRTLTWDERFGELTGYRADGPEATFAGWLEMLHPDDHVRVSDSLESVLDSDGDYWEARYRLRHANGRWLHVLDRGLVLRDATGKALRMVGGVADISAQMVAEQRLREGQRLEAIGQLTGGVAHDFNNLLTVILGNAETLQDRLRDDPARAELAGMIGEAAHRAAELTRQLLAFARKQALEPTTVDVNRRLAELEPLLRRSLGEHVQIELSRGGGLWHALVDPTQLDNAVLNLCLNARDAMPQGGRLTIETANAVLDADYATANPEVHPGQYVMVAVSDTGSGISAEHLGRVFEPFFTTKEKGKGTGLGLSMVYGFVKQSGGHIKVYSEPGEGATVRLYLPRVVGAAPAAASPIETMPHGRGEVVLVVEDETMVLRHAVEQLELLGYRPLFASEPQQALEVLQAHPEIELLFTDVVMPGMNGRELAERARVLRPGLKVLYTSGYTENAIVHHGRLDPGVRLLPKPWRRSELARRVRDAIDGT